MRHPSQRQAQADSEKLAGTTVDDAYWTDTDFVIWWSNELLLHVFVDGDDARWTLRKSPPRINERRKERIGSAPVILRWPAPVGDSVMDRSVLAAARRGSKFVRLFINEMALLVYCRDHLIWWFSAVRRTDLDQPILCVTEDE